MCGLCGFLYKDPSRYGAIGQAMFDMLTPLDRRGTDSTGVALYGPPQDDSYVVRVRMEANGSTPDRVLEALGGAGAVTEQSHSGPNLRVRISYAGDLGDLTDQIEDVPATEVFSIGRSMEIVKDVGDASAVEAAVPYSGFEGSHAIGHTRMATESLVDVAHSHPFWARPFADISVVHNGHITNYHKLRRRLEAKGHRFATGNDSEAIAVYIADKLEEGSSLEDALRASVHDLDGTFAYLISTPEGIGVARDRFALKPLIFAESDDVALIASEEIALRRVDDSTDLVPRELGAGEVRWWLR
ncbi:MAG: methylamine---glutamate N-methyltransferase subunit [Gaiellales bacterium]|nr:methylamine---glutamate N-methyltransferase subunit [Gaiellales bacterium]